MSLFRMPSLGADMEDGTLVEWLVQPGARVKRGDIVAVVETQKGAIEIEICNSNDLNGTPCSPRNLIRITRQHCKGTGANGTRTEKTDSHRHAATRGIKPSRRNISRTPRTA